MSGRAPVSEAGTDPTRGVSEFGISNASGALCIGYQEAVDMVTLGEVYKSSQLVIVSLRVCSGPQQTRSDRAEISTGGHRLHIIFVVSARYQRYQMPEVA